MTSDEEINKDHQADAGRTLRSLLAGIQAINMVVGGGYLQVRGEADRDWLLATGWLVLSSLLFAGLHLVVAWKHANHSLASELDRGNRRKAKRTEKWRRRRVVTIAFSGLLTLCAAVALFMATL